MQISGDDIFENKSIRQNIRKNLNRELFRFGSAEERLAEDYQNNPNNLLSLNRLIEYYDSASICDEQINNYYWELVKLSVLQNNRNTYIKALKYFSGKLNKTAGLQNIVENFPADLAHNRKAADIYLQKEKNLIPNDFSFRYKHYDYKYLKAYNRNLGAAVLHLGCSLGINSVILARNGHFIHGVDVQPEAINKAVFIRGNEPPEIARRISYQTASFTEMTLPDNYFDSVIAFDVFEHIYENDFECILEKISKALKPNGSLLFHFPSGKSFYDPAHVTLFTIEKASEIFSKKFRIKKLYEITENEYPSDKRISLFAVNKSETAPDRKKYSFKAIEKFSSGFFTNYYTSGKAKGGISKLYNAVKNKTPFSMIRIGDMETRLLAYKKTDIGYEADEAEAMTITSHLGINPSAFSDSELISLQNGLMEFLLEADILGTHRHTVNEKWSKDISRVFSAYGMPGDYLPSEFDVVFNAEIFDQGYLLPLLREGRILLIGNAAPKFARLLRNKDYRNRFQQAGMPDDEIETADPIYVPHSGVDAFDALADIWEKVQCSNFDIAFIAASYVGKILAGRIKKYLGRAALDIGWNMQYLADVSSPVASATDYNYMKGRRGFNNLFKGRIK